MVEASGDGGNDRGPVQETIEIEHQKSEDYNEFPVSGIRGGLSRRNDFRMEMFTEYLSHPKGQSYLLNQDNEISDIEEFGEYSIVRTLHATGVATPENAFYFGLWMISQVLGVPEDRIERLIRDEYNI